MPANSKDELEIKKDIKLLQQAREHLKNKEIALAFETVYQTLYIEHYYQSTALQNSFLFFFKELFETFGLNNSPEYKEYIRFCNPVSFTAQKQERKSLLIYLWNSFIYQFSTNTFVPVIVTAEFLYVLLTIEDFIVIFIQNISTTDINNSNILHIKGKYLSSISEKGTLEEVLYNILNNLVGKSYRTVKDFNRGFSYLPYFLDSEHQKIYRNLWQNHFQVVKEALKVEDFDGKPDKGDLPQTLFQYKKLNDKTLDSIINGYFYLSNPEEFNDYADPIYKVKPSALSDTMSSMSNDPNVQIRISCFTTNPENFLMWGHYADKSTGICVQYEISKNIETEKSTFWKVNYEKNIEMLGSWVSDDIKYWNMPAFLSVKHKNWEYENEYRYIALCEGENFEQNDTPFKIKAPIKAIYLGTKIKRDTQYYALIALAKSKNIPIYQYTPHPTEMFSLVKKQVEI